MVSVGRVGPRPETPQKEKIMARYNLRDELGRFCTRDVYERCQHTDRWNDQLSCFICHVCSYPTSDGHWHPNHECPVVEEDEDQEC